MGKSRKRSRHCNTGYPYNPIRVAHIHVVRPKVRHSSDSSLFIGNLPTQDRCPQSDQAIFRVCHVLQFLCQLSPLNDGLDLSTTTFTIVLLTRQVLGANE